MGRRLGSVLELVVPVSCGQPASRNGCAVLFAETPSSPGVLGMWFPILSLGTALLSSSTPATSATPHRRLGGRFSVAETRGSCLMGGGGRGLAGWTGCVGRDRQVGQAAAGGDQHWPVWERTVRGRAPSGARRPQVALTSPPLFPRCPVPREDYSPDGA